jgi:hypothetical protein
MTEGVEAWRRCELGGKVSLAGSDKVDLIIPDLQGLRDHLKNHFPQDNFIQFLKVIFKKVHLDLIPNKFQNN